MDKNIVFLPGALTMLAQIRQLDLKVHSEAEKREGKGKEGGIGKMETDGNDGRTLPTPCMNFWLRPIAYNGLISLNPDQPLPLLSAPLFLPCQLSLS